MKKTYVTYDESPYQPGKYVVQFNHDELPLASTEGSFNLLAARLLNLDYADYLRFCRDILGAEIIGKGSKYPVAYFKKGKNLFALVHLLNARLNLVMYDRAHPDHEQHKEEVEAYRSKMREARKNVLDK